MIALILRVCRVELEISLAAALVCVFDHGWAGITDSWLVVKLNVVPGLAVNRPYVLLSTSVDQTPACENYAFSPPDENSFASKEYLSRELLQHVLSLDLLPEIIDEAHNK